MRRHAEFIEGLTISLAAIVVSMLLFGIFVGFQGINPFDVYALMYKGSFGTWFSVQNTLLRASPLLLTALCTALPAQMGMVIIGGEGALVLGGLAAIAVGVPLGTNILPVWMVEIAMALAGMIAGGALIGLAGFLRHKRGVNETISSLLLNYIAIAVFKQLVEGPMRDPSSLNKPSTFPLADGLMFTDIPGTSVHWGLVIGLVFCLAAYVLLYKTTFGFAARVVGGNMQAGRSVGLPVGRLILIVTALAGAAAGLAGMIEIAATQGSANASLDAGYGATGILVAFLARQNPLAIIPVAALLGGIGASDGLLQRRLDMPDATSTVFQGILFVVLLSSETFSGRLRLWLRNRQAARLVAREARAVS